MKEISLDDFIESAKIILSEFESVWKSNMNSGPDRWPNKLSEGD